MIRCYERLNRKITIEKQRKNNREIKMRKETKVNNKTEVIIINIKISKIYCYVIKLCKKFL